MSAAPDPLGQALVGELRAELARQQLSGRWLARRLGAPHNTVARWLRGQPCPGVDELDAMCRVLGLRLADLLRAASPPVG